jgi:hypothetical protein
LVNASTSVKSALKQNQNFPLSVSFLNKALYLQAEWVLYAEEEKHG